MSNMYLMSNVKSFFHTSAISPFSAQSYETTYCKTFQLYFVYILFLKHLKTLTLL